MKIFIKLEKEAININDQVRIPKEMVDAKFVDVDFEDGAIFVNGTCKFKSKMRDM